MGLDATRQAGGMKDVMLHETAVAWLDKRLKLTTPAKAWEETPEELGARLWQACEYINANYEVEGLCKELPGRLQKLREVQGGRLRK